MPGLKKVYGIEDFKEFKALDAGGPLTTSALNKGDIDIGRVFTTQVAIDKADPEKVASDWLTQQGLSDPGGPAPQPRASAQSSPAARAAVTASSRVATANLR